MRPTADRLALALGPLLLAACAGKTEATPATDPAEAAAPIRDFFDGLAGQDCGAVEAALGGSMKQRFEQRGGCAHLFAEDPLAGARLVAVESVRRDGRDPRAYIVRLTIEKGGKLRTANARVERGPDGFHIVDM